MSIDNIKTIWKENQNNWCSYDIYEHENNFFYRYQNPKLTTEYKQLDVVLSEDEKAWVSQPASDVTARDTLPSSIWSKIEQDRAKKNDALRKRIGAAYERMLREKAEEETAVLRHEDASARQSEVALEVDSIVEETQAPNREETQAHQKIVAELQTIVTLLARLKGTEPQLERVRAALSKAMTKLGGAEPAVAAPELVEETPEVGRDENISSADNIQNNIDVLVQVNEKLALLLRVHGESIAPDLRDALNELKLAVDDSIEQARCTLQTQRLREEHQAARSTTPEVEPRPTSDDDDTFTP